MKNSPSPSPAPAPTARPLSDLPPLLRELAVSVALIAPLGLAVGSACALFLYSLDQVTHLRWQFPWLLYFLPLAGLLVGLLYFRFGKSVESGNNLLLDEIHQPGAGVPIRIAPLVLVGTLITHLFGGSAGREGTAVQMGGGIAAALSRALPFLPARQTRILLMAGIAGGFGGVFGTPIAGAVFAMEVLALGRITYEAVIPCLVSAVVADWACGAWGVGHTVYRISALGDHAHLDGLLIMKVAFAAALFGLTARAFAEGVHALKHRLDRLIRAPYLRPALGGVGVIGLALVFGTDYLGLGVSSPDPHATTILSSFHPGGADPLSFALKLLFTVLTLASGFKGGEVTPLFFIGATLGNSLAVVLDAPVDLFAGLGFIAVFAAAANTPLACTFMAVELFGLGGGPHPDGWSSGGSTLLYFAIASFVAYFFGGHRGIYLSQRVGTPKLTGTTLPPDTTLRQTRDP
ncbi:MAG: voltage-gated chloride channel family protein [Deltaproteobacteria bacterium]|nr:voltage-gated chloride channel family protein [Deltaproteobacteria bacterium]